MIKNIILLFLLLVLLTSCKVSRFAYYNFADITDHEIFPARELKRDSTDTFYFKERNDKKLVIEMKDDRTFEDYLEDNSTVAFLIIHNDTIKYEKYFNDYERESVVASFSMAKSFTSFLIGCAIEDGLINSVNDPVIEYIPELKENGFEDVSLEHVLQMTSGLDFNESYWNPFGHAATFYYGRTLRKSTLKLDLKNEPGKSMDYVSGNTQLLGMILDRVLENKTVTQYLEEKLWKKVGMEYDASWSIDKKKDGLEKTFCCLNARAIDFAKFGRLYLNKGNWNGDQLISESWVEKSTKWESLNGSSPGYQYQWWITSLNGDYTAKGILGQFIYVSPEENLIIVRLGEKYGDVNWIGTFEKIKEIVNR